MNIRRILSILALTVGAVLWALLLRPTALGGPTTLVIVSGTSMEPTLHGGDLVVTRARGSYDVGDVVTFRVPEGGPGAGDLVIHRLTGGTPEGGFTTQGDNRDRPDDWTPTEDDVVGSEWFAVPGAGSVLARLHDPTLLAALAGGMTVTVVLMREPGESGRHGTRRGADPAAADVTT
ncbi:MAG: signal peptidase I [Ornithinibacter sp.]